MNREIHIVVVTGQPLANLIPILERPPHTVLMMVSDAMENASTSFKSLIQRLLPEVQVRILSGLPSTNVEHIQEWALTMLDELPTDVPRTVNLTGGTKLMVLALYQILQDKRSQFIYLNLENSCIETLYPDVSTRAIPSLINLETYLKAMDKTYRKSLSDNSEWRLKSDERREITREFVQLSARKVDVLRAFNQVMAQVHDQKNNTQQPRTFNAGFRPLMDFIRKCRDAQLIDLDEASARFYIKNDDISHYLSGGWLEEYCWQIAKPLNFDNLACGVDFTDDIDRKKNIRNELDMMIVHNNRMLAIECKSGRIDIDGSDSEIIYKLDSIATHAGGLNCDRLLVSAQELDHQTTEKRQVYPSARAQAADIETCAGADLLNLKERLQNWRDGKGIRKP